jgi:hypothetical protein
MAKEALEFESKHALEEAERRAQARAEAERWAREQVRKTPGWPRSWANSSLL